jgi:TetR/AcrR family transcriptional regulator, cholesterol catabolism regulator
MADTHATADGTSMGRTTRGPYAPAQTRELLLSSALELFGRQGFHATSVQQIVDGAGLTKGAFYHHFASKEDVLRLIHDEFLEVQRETVARIVAGGGTPTEQLRQIVLASVLSVAQYQSSVTVFFQERRYLTGERADDVRDRRDAVEAMMEQVVRNGIAAGELDPSINPRVAVFGIVGLSAWLHQWYRPDGPLSAEEIADELARMVLNGLVRGPAGD